MKILKDSEIWFAEFSCILNEGDPPKPVYLTAKELNSGRIIKIGDFKHFSFKSPLYSIDENPLFISFNASLFLGCFLSLKMDFPSRLIDLSVEFRNSMNGKIPEVPNTLEEALAYYKCSVLKKGNSNVDLIEALYLRMRNVIDMPNALLRGEYMKSVAVMEQNGIPIDTATYRQLIENWDVIKDTMIKELDDFSIYEGGKFNTARFIEYLEVNNFEWDYLDSGNLNLQQETFDKYSKIYPELDNLRQLRCLLRKMNLQHLAIGNDGRNRCSLVPFKSKTGRNQPKSSDYIFGKPAWLRMLIKPPEGHSVAYIDYEQQEFGIAAALSGDMKMKAAYDSGDSYFAFGQQIGFIPLSGTKSEYKVERDICKICILGLQYGMGANSLARALKVPVDVAEDLINKYRRTYYVFWNLSEKFIESARYYHEIKTVFGWTQHINGKLKIRSIKNFPMQANGSEMLRLACIWAREAGIKICAPVHDAILIEAPTQEIEEKVSMMETIMQKASKIVLNGYKLRTETKIYHYPDRYWDERGRKMWEIAKQVIENNLFNFEDSTCSISGQDLSENSTPVQYFNEYNLYKEWVSANECNECEGRRVSETSFER